ncbi:MAG: hypothetical protein Q9222_006017 [Ikaeria aurantiellina]
MPPRTSNTTSPSQTEKQEITEEELRALEYTVPATSIEEEADKICIGPRNSLAANIPNSKTRNIISNSAEVIFLNAAPGIKTHHIRNRLFIALNLTLITIDNILTTEFRALHSPYRDLWQHLQHTGWQSPLLPDRIPTEVLGRYIEKAICQQGKRRFLVDGFPKNEGAAAVLEEDVCLIRAYIHVSGARKPSVPISDFENYHHANRPVRDKLEASGRLFRLDARKPHQNINADVDLVVSILRSIEYQARLNSVGDVFRRR